MNRKWVVLGVTMTAAFLTAASLSIAQDEKEEGSELHQIMEKVQKNNATIIRGVRNAVFYRRSAEDVAKAGKELVELGKKAKPLTDLVKDVEGVQKVEKWNELMDAFLKQAEGFSELAAKEGTTQPQARDSYKEVAKTCTNCHEVFRIEDADF